MSTRLLTRFLPRLSSAFHLPCFSYPTARSTRCSPSLYSLLTTTDIPRFPPAATAVRSFTTNLPKYCLPEDVPGMDWQHWQVILFAEEIRRATRDQIIDTYIKTLAMFVGSEEEARMRIYSISTKHCYCFGYRGSVELANQIKAANLPQLAHVVPDAYQYPETQDYGGEPFINGQALPYDPKYYECWNANLRPPRIRMKKSKNLEERSRDVQNSEVQGVASNMGEAVAPGDMASLSTVGGVPLN